MKIETLKRNQIVLLKLPEDFQRKELKQYLLNKPLLRAKIKLTSKNNFYFDLTGLGREHFDRFNNSFHLGWEDGIELNLPQYCWKFPTIPDIMKYLQTTGSIFTIWFIKKDGTERKMTCRFGVTKHLAGGKSNLDPAQFYTVYSLADKDYRAINKERIIKVKTGGTIYENA